MPYSAARESCRASLAGQGAIVNRCIFFDWRQLKKSTTVSATHMLAQLTKLVQLRRDRRRLQQAAESMWSRIPKRSLYTRARLSLAFNMRQENTQVSALARVYGMAAIGIADPRHYYVINLWLQTLPCTLNDIRMLMNEDLQLPDHMWAALASNSQISRDLYDYMIANGHRVFVLTHLVHCVDNLQHAPQERARTIPGELYTPITFTELTDAQRQLLHDRLLTRQYLMISATTLQQLWACEKLRHLMCGTYLDDYYANPRFSITHKLQTWRWVETLEAIPWTKMYTCKPRLAQLICHLQDSTQWIDYVDFIALRTTYDLSNVRTVIGAPLAWWRQPERRAATLRDRIQIAIERGLPGTIDMLIKQLLSSDGAKILRESLNAYDLIRVCYRQRFVNAIACHWLARTRRMR